MKTRSQTKNEKLEKEKPKIPQLNEDVFGIILKYAVEKQQRHVMDTIDIMREHLATPHVPKHIIIQLIPYTIEPSPNHLIVEWPDYLDSNSRRLIHHTKVKLFPDYHVRIPKDIEVLMHSKRDLDLLWQTFKHFEEIHFWHDFRDENYEDYENEELPRRVFQELWKKIQARRTPFCRMLEERLS